MGKFTVGFVGNVKIKMDTPDDVYFDAKDPHVSIEGPGIYLNHVDLYSIDNIVGTGDRELQGAIRWIRDNKSELIKMYENKAPYRIY